MLSGLPTSFADEREQIVYEMAICLGNSRWVSKGLYDRAVKALGRVGITDAITFNGLLHQRLDDLGILRRAGRGAGHRALDHCLKRRRSAKQRRSCNHTKPQPGTSEPAETPNEFRDFVRSVTARFIPAPGAG
jgi:hypothetical protein